MLRGLVGLMMVCALGCSGARRTQNLSVGVVAPELSQQRTREHPKVWGLRNVQRTFRLLSSSTAERPQHVRVLFYGQSITASAWSRRVAEDLRERFPLADLEIENRAIGGFPSQLLLKTAETDLYSYYPDLVIFHAYGAHDAYEELVRHLHERTTAEIMLQTDHVLKSADLVEQTDPQRLSPQPDHWDAFMNNEFLPSLVERYQTALCDVRNAWKQHLRTLAEPPEFLLKDGLHLNARGDALMASYVEQCLKSAPEAGASPAEGWVGALVMGRDIRWGFDSLTVEFAGNRIDAIVRGEGAPMEVRIDGKKPSEFPELYRFTRAHSPELGLWPPVFDVSANALRVVETFTLRLTRVQAQAPDQHLYTFTVHGSVTGDDGVGSTDQPFESRSQRLVIDPEDWNIPYAFELAGKTPPEHFSIDIAVEPQFTDTLASLIPPNQLGNDRVVTLAQGLPNTKHTLVLTASDGSRLLALRIYRPPLARF